MPDIRFTVLCLFSLVLSGPAVALAQGHIGAGFSTTPGVARFVTGPANPRIRARYGQGYESRQGQDQPFGTGGSGIPAGDSECRVTVQHPQVS